MSTNLARRPVVDMTDMRSRLDRLFDDLIGHPEAGTWIPALDVHRSDDALTLRADVPGMTPEEVHIRVTDGILEITGEHSEETTRDEGGFVRRERRSGSFRRSVALPSEADPKHIEAVVKNGVAEITVPLSADRADSTIEITPSAG